MDDFAYVILVFGCFVPIILYMVIYILAYMKCVYDEQKKKYLITEEKYSKIKDENHINIVLKSNKGEEAYQKNVKSIRITKDNNGAYALDLEVGNIFGEINKLKINMENEVEVIEIENV